MRVSSVCGFTSCGWELLHAQEFVLEDGDSGLSRRGSHLHSSYSLLVAYELYVSSYKTVLTLGIGGFEVIRLHKRTMVLFSELDVISMSLLLDNYFGSFIFI